MEGSPPRRGFTGWPDLISPRPRSNGRGLLAPSTWTLAHTPTRSPNPVHRADGATRRATFNEHGQPDGRGAQCTPRLVQRPCWLIAAPRLQMTALDGAPRVFAPTLVSGRSRADSASSDSDASLKEAAPERPSLSWADSGNVMQQPALTYHHGPSLTTIASSEGTDSVPYVGYTPSPTATAPRKRFRAPQKSTMLDRSVGNVRSSFNVRKRRLPRRANLVHPARSPSLG